MSESAKITKPFKPIVNKLWYDIFDKIDKDIREITEEYYNELIEKIPMYFQFILKYLILQTLYYQMK